MTAVKLGRFRGAGRKPRSIAGWAAAVAVLALGLLLGGCGPNGQPDRLASQSDDGASQSDYGAPEGSTASQSPPPTGDLFSGGSSQVPSPAEGRPTSIAHRRNHADDAPPHSPGGAKTGDDGDSASAADDAVDSTATPGDRQAPVRHIIYDTEMELRVEDYGQFEAELPALVTRYGGFIAESRTDRQSGDRRSGRWVLRVPVTSYGDLLSAVNGLGYVLSRRERADDVTAEVIDLQARISNAQRLETRIGELLATRVGKLEEVLEIERELARVREAIERMQARQRFLADRASLATITLTVREQETFVAAAAPSLGERMGRAWRGAVHRVRTAGVALLVAAAALTPPLLALLPLGLPLWWWYRRRGGRDPRAAA